MAPRKLRSDSLYALRKKRKLSGQCVIFKNIQNKMTKKTKEVLHGVLEQNNPQLLNTISSPESAAGQFSVEDFMRGLCGGLDSPGTQAGKIYLIGSLRNPKIPDIAKRLRCGGLNVFDDWYSAGPEADDYWKKYEQDRGHNFIEALQGFAAKHVYEFDKHHLDTSTAVVLALPAGKSGHLELGYSIGRGIPGYILLEEGQDERFDVMYQFASGVFDNVDDLIRKLKS